MNGNQSRLGNSSAGRIGLLLLLLVAVGLGIWLIFRNGTNNNGGRAGNGGQTAGPDEIKVSQQHLKTAVQAVAAAEDAEFERALELWRELVADYPDYSVFQVNEAVTVLKWIDETNNRLSNRSFEDQADKQRLEAELDQAYESAEIVINQLSQMEDADPRITLLRASLLEARARRLPYPEDDAERLEAAKLLATALVADPAQPLLACKFDDLVQMLPEAGAELKKQNVEALYASWQATPRNLLLLIRTMDTLLVSQDERLLELLDPSLELTRPMWFEVQSSINLLKPDEYLPKVATAIKAGEWTARDVRMLPRWLNVIRAMSSGFRPDYRLVKPDIMALLDTSFLSQLVAEQSSVPMNAIAEYAEVAFPGPAQYVAWYDYDLDLDFDLITISDSELRLFEHNESGGLASEPSQTVALDMEPGGILIAEFFTVDDPKRPRLTQSVTELIQNSDDSAAGADVETEDDLVSELSNRHDTFQEVLVWGAQGATFIAVAVDEQEGSLKLEPVIESTGIEELKGVIAAVALDIESDGDLDIVASTTSGLRVLQNNGNRTFEDISQYSSFEDAPAGLFSLVACDFDQDLDQDVLAVAAESDHVTLLENIMHGQFQTRAIESELWSKWPSAKELQVAELDGNSSWDLVVASADQIGLATTRTVEPGTTLPLASVSVPANANRIQVGDLNNDSHLDILSGGPEGLSIFTGEKSSWNGHPIGSVSEDVSQLDVVDSNRNGILDIALIVDGEARVLIASQLNQQYLSARVRGINDTNGGGRINHYGVGSTLELWTRGRQQRRVVDKPLTHFGLGASSPDDLRIIFTNGLTQNLENPPVDSLVEERQELKGSCPFVYGWNGDKFVLITDLLWNAPLGLQTARGEIMPDRRWEYLLLPGELVQPRDGYYELRITEELWEIAYFDHVQLTAVDHPPRSRVFSNEKVGPPAIAKHTLFGVTESIYPIAAKDQRQRNVLAGLQSLDRNYVQAFERLICQGLAEPHFIELDFGRLDTERDVRLFLTGWMHPTDTSLNIGISQNPERSPPEPPSLWVVDENGHWVCAQPMMGFPGGKPKSIVVDLNEVFRSDDHRLRIGSSQQIYWDEAFIAYDTPNAFQEEQALELHSAQLHYRGFGKLYKQGQQYPHWYAYDEVSQESKWPLLAGPFTRYGDVQTTLAEDDDRLVVMTAGDEIVLRFKIVGPAPPPGWTRDFVLHSTGWDKDADLNTIAGQSSLPLPFAAQESYPAPPQQEKQYEEVLRKNADNLTRYPEMRSREGTAGRPLD